VKFKEGSHVVPLGIFRVQSRPPWRRSETRSTGVGDVKIWILMNIDMNYFAFCLKIYFLSSDLLQSVKAFRLC
jgi:hypothetical protein